MSKKTTVKETMVERVVGKQELEVTFASKDLANRAIQKGLATRPTPDQVKAYEQKGGRELDHDETLIVVDSAMQADLGAWMAFEQQVNAK